MIAERTIAPYREDERKVDSDAFVCTRALVPPCVAITPTSHGALKSPREDQRRGRGGRANATVSQFFAIFQQLLSSGPLFGAIRIRSSLNEERKIDRRWFLILLFTDVFN